MPINLNAGVSALQAYGDRQAIQAHNVANVNTDDFKKQRGLLTEADPQGVHLTVDRVDTPGPQRVTETAEGSQVVEMSNTDLTEEIPQTMVNQQSFDANGTMIRTQDEMLGTLLDITA